MGHIVTAVVCEVEGKMEKDTRGHRRSSSEPWNIHDFFSATGGSFDELDDDITLTLSGDYHSSPSRPSNHGIQPQSLTNLSGVKHMRSFESDTHTFSSKAPTTPSLRRNRSMPAVEFQIHHPSNFISSSDNPSFLQQIQYHGELSPENGQSSVPNSTSMDALESILRANSEDWNDAWHQMSSQQYVYDLPDDDSANTPKILQEISPHIPDTPNHVQRKKLIPSYAFPTSPRPSYQVLLPHRLFSLSEQPSHVVQERAVSAESLFSHNRNLSRTPDRILTHFNSVASRAAASIPSSNLAPRDNPRASFWSNPPLNAIPSEKKTHKKSYSTGMVFEGDLSSWIDLKSNSHPGISEIEFHPAKSNLMQLNSSEYMDINDRNRARGRYRCGRCGQLKANHDCPFASEVPTRSISTQCERMAFPAHIHPFLKENTITVGSPRVSSSSIVLAPLTVATQPIPPHVSHPPTPPPIHILHTTISSPPRASPVLLHGSVEIEKLKEIRILHPSLRNLERTSEQPSRPQSTDTPFVKRSYTSK